jgi:hypothetical protein
VTSPEAQMAVATAIKVQITRLCGPNPPELKEPIDPHSVRGLRASPHSLVSYGSILRVQASLKVGTSGWRGSWGVVV